MITNLSHLPKVTDRLWFCTTGELPKHIDTFSTGIQWLIDRNYSHSAVIYYSPEAQCFIITNCTGAAAQLDTEAQFFEDGKTVIRRMFEVKTTPDQRAKFIKRLIELDGTPYSPTIQLFWLAIAYKMGWAFERFCDGDTSMWCSEYVDQIMKAIEFPPTYELLERRHRQQITPRCNIEAWTLLAKLLPDRVRELKGVENL